MSDTEEVQELQPCVGVSGGSQRSRERARQRWALVSLVRSADMESDQTARQEKLQERVDEWMNNLCKTMTTKEPLRGLRTVSFAKPGVSREQQHSQAEEELALERRIKKREEEETRKERELVLSGKIKPSESLVDKSDKIFQIFEKVQNMEKKSRKVNVANSVSLPMFPNTKAETAEEEEENSNTKAAITTLRNPVLQSFDQAKNVDDLYRIADYWLSPTKDRS